MGDGQNVPGLDEAGDPDDEQRGAPVSLGLGTRGARTRSHVHGERRGRFFVHLVVVLLSVSAIAFASQYPRSGSAFEPVLPTFAYSGVAGAMRLSDSNTFLKAPTSLFTEDSVAVMMKMSSSSPEVLSVRAVGGVAPTSSISSGVSAAAATSSVQGAGVVPLPDILDPTEPYAIHVTQPGDSISTIAAAYGIEESTILSNNPTVEDGDLIPLGLELFIPRADGILHKVGQGESLSDIVGSYDNIDFDTARGYRSNWIDDPDNLKPGTFVMLPGATVKPPPPPPPPPPPVAPVPGGGTPGGGGGTPPPASGGRFSNPLSASYMVTDEFGIGRGGGTIHTGIDLALYGQRSAIFSACNGVVSRTEWLTYSYGYHVVVDCGDGWTTLYAHFSRIDVTVGQAVNQGTLLGMSGLTGFTTGEHLHFEIRLKGAPVNPAAYIGF